MVERELVVAVELADDAAGAWTLLRVSGEVDIQTSPILEGHLTDVLDRGESSVLIDLGQVTFLDSTGLSVLVAGLKRCQDAGGELHLRSLRPNVLRVLEITGLTTAFHVDADARDREPDQPVASWAPGRRPARGAGEGRIP